MFLVKDAAITAAQAAFTPLGKVLKSGASYSPTIVNLLAVFAHGTGGTSLDVFVQTSFDGVTWYDMLHFSQFTTSNTNCYFPQNVISIIPTTTNVNMLKNDQSLTSDNTVLSLLNN